MSLWSCGLQVRVVEGSDKGRTFPLDSPDMTVGRGKSAGDRAPGWILLFDHTVSRIHADLRWEEAQQGYVLVNRSDTNPTKVNGVAATEVLLKAGDQIRIGNSVLDLQQADFRFGGQQPPAVARVGRPMAAAPSVAAPVPPPNLQFAHGGIDQEKQESTKKARRVVALTTRPKMHLVCLSEPQQGQSWGITGMTIAVGGPSEPSPDDDRTQRKYDQEIPLKDKRIPFQALTLLWRELEGGFLLSRTPQGVNVQVTLERRVDGTEWIAELPRESPVLIRKNDIIWLGDTALHLTVPEEE